MFQSSNAVPKTGLEKVLEKEFSVEEGFVMCYNSFSTKQSINSSPNHSADKGDSNMKHGGHRCLTALIAFVLVVSFVLGGPFVCNAKMEISKLAPEQQKAIAMLNYITVLSQEINDSKYSRLFMEEAYSQLINNLQLKAVDEKTNTQINRLTNIIEEYRMIDIKRDRLQFLYEQNQAQAIHSAIPNPLGLLSAIKAANPIEFASSIAYMAVDAYSSYTKYTTETNIQHLKDGWELDEQERKNLHENRQGVYNYMWRIVNSYDLPENSALRENAIQDFVKWKNDENIDGRIQFLVSHFETYQAYGGYWLLLAESYYKNEKYDKVLECVDHYIHMGTDIFIQDHELARVLPLAIVSAGEVLENKEYIRVVSDYAERLENNAADDNWALRYFVAQTYVSLYDKTQDRKYLDIAFEIVKNSVNDLCGAQRTLNNSYVAPVEEVKPKEDDVEAVKKQYEKYNTQLKEVRKTELPPVYDPLLMNCDLMFALADQLQFDDEAVMRSINGFMHPQGAPLFLTKALDERYSFFRPSASDEEAKDEIYFDGSVITLPVEYVTDLAAICVTVTLPGHDEEVVFKDEDEIKAWRIEKVERKKEGDVSSFRATYTCDKAKQYAWVPDSKIKIEVYPAKKFDVPAYEFNYLARGTKNAWYDYLKPWEGHKNNWYEYAMVWQNAVEFVAVD